MSTLTFRSLALRFMIVNVPKPPAVPHAPSAVEPLTDTTIPNTETVGGGLDDQILTVEAMNRPCRTCPTAVTVVSTHTLAKLGEAMPRAEKCVPRVTWTVVRDVLRLTSRKVPVPPAAPHAPSADDPFTAMTNP